MKKILTLLVAFLFTAGLAFAQNNDANVTQTGNTNEAQIDQVVSIGATVNLSQTENGSGSSFADIDQTGGANFVNLEQIGNNSATIDQDGKHTVAGFSSAPGTGLDYPAIQENTGGDQNVLNITQRNNFSQVRVDQIGSGNSIDVYQGGGISNVARLNQLGDSNIMDVSLDGSINRVEIQQLGVGGHTANVDIVGEANNMTSTGSSYIYQDGQGHTSDVMITGDANYYNIYQTGVSNTANVTVNGSGNTALITQSN